MLLDRKEGRQPLSCVCEMMKQRFVLLEKGLDLFCPFFIALQEFCVSGSKEYSRCKLSCRLHICCRA